MCWVAAQNIAPIFVVDPHLACVTTGGPESYPCSTVNCSCVKGAGKISGGFGVVFLRGTGPRPALIRPLDVNTVPEPLDGPIDVKVEVANINFAPTIDHLFEAVEALTRRTEATDMFLESFAVPGAAFRCFNFLYNRTVKYFFVEKICLCF